MSRGWSLACFSRQKCDLWLDIMSLIHFLLCTIRVWLVPRCLLQLCLCSWDFLAGKEPRDRRSHDRGEGAAATRGLPGLLPRPWLGDASAFPCALRIHSCNFFSSSSRSREYQSHQAVPRLTELCTQVDWNFFSQQFRMHKPGTGRTSAIPEILGCVNHNHHSAEIRISLKGFLVPAVPNQARVAFTHPARWKPRTPVTMLPQPGVLRSRPPCHARTCAPPAPSARAHPPAARAAPRRR